MRRYLREFLSDPRVLDIHPLGRWLLLNLIILPTRPSKSAEAYSKVWTPEGSPLLVHSQGLARGLQAALPETPVVLGMRYGNPSLPSALKTLRDQGCDRVGVVPRDQERRQPDAGSGVALAGLANEARLWHLWQLPPHRVEQPARGDYHHAVRGHEAVESLDRIFEQGLRARQRQELLGQGGAAGGPETGAGSSGHHDGVQHGMHLSVRGLSFSLGRCLCR